MKDQHEFTWWLMLVLLMDHYSHVSNQYDASQPAWWSWLIKKVLLVKLDQLELSEDQHPKQNMLVTIYAGLFWRKLRCNYI